MACDFNELLLNWKLNKIDIKATNNDGLTPLDQIKLYHGYFTFFLVK